MAASKRWAFLIQSPLPTIPFARLQDNHRFFHPSLMRGSEVSFESGLVSSLHLVLEGCELRRRDSMRPNACSVGAVHSIRHISANEKELNMDKKSFRGPCDLNRSINMEEDSSACHAISTASSSSRFDLLMENLDEIEDIFAWTDLVRLERDIMVHIGRLGAQKFFQACLSRTSMAESRVNSNVPLSKHFVDNLFGFKSTDHNCKKLVSTGKKEQRKLRRTRALERVVKMSTLSMPRKRVNKVEQSTVSLPSVVSDPIAISKSKSRRAVTARNESEMSRGVKEVANLERTHIKLEEETGRPPSYARWAEAAGIDEKTLHQRLQFGWYCRDKLIRSTRSLVMYLAKNYRGMGIAFDDLLQAGNVGVLNGAERFDNKRGYQFSTYVQYWIRKSMLALVGRHSRGIQIPARMEKIVKQIKHARRALYNKEGRYPPDEEIAEFAGLSLANVRMARKCSRVLGSIDKEIGNGWRMKFMEVTPDTSVQPPDEVIVWRHMREDILELIEGLHPRERQVLVLRYGFGDGRCKSLEEIGRLLHVTKEGIRKIEKVALSKISREDIQANLKHYLLL